MERCTTAADVINTFESSFQDQHTVPEDLEYLWLEKAIGRYSAEIAPLNYDPEIQEFDCKLDMYVVDTLGQLMKKFYQERELSKVNKKVSIIGKDLSIDGSNGCKTAAKSELDYINGEVAAMFHNQKPGANTQEVL